MDIKLKNRHRVLYLILFVFSLAVALGAICFYRPIGEMAEWKRQRLTKDWELARSREDYATAECAAQWQIDDDMVQTIWQNGYLFYVDFEKMNAGEGVASEEILFPELRSLYQGKYQGRELSAEAQDIDLLYTSVRDEISNRILGWQTAFSNMEGSWDYRAFNMDTEQVLTNIGDENILDWVQTKEDMEENTLDSTYYDIWFILQYDEYGQVKVLASSNIDSVELYRKLQGMRHINVLGNIYVDGRAVDAQAPRNMNIFYGCVNDILDMGTETPCWETYWGKLSLYADNGGSALFLGVLVLSVVMAVILGRWGQKRGMLAKGIFAFPMECCVPGLFLSAAFYELSVSAVCATYTGDMKKNLISSNYLEWAAEILVTGYNIFLWMIFVQVVVWSILVLWPRTKGGFLAYLKERSAVSRLGAFLGKSCKCFYVYLTRIDITESANKTVLKLVFINLAILIVLCSMWFFGIAGLVLYSIGLYLLMRNYYGTLQSQYQTLVDAANQMAEGKLNVALPQDLGIFNPLKVQLLRVQNGFKEAVEQEVKSQRMKTELITNVSHDLKTPLTAIITYVDLLKNEDITPEERASYIATLEKKSGRLRSLIEDLFEVSKAESANVTLHKEPVDLVNLLKQVRLEMEDRLQESGLTFRWDFPGEKTLCYLDGQKTCRIFENLLGNIVKYSMAGSRAYIEIRQTETYAQVTMKNMSATELNFDPEEITERFVRGDLSRNTEGSGLGLAIARSFVELQGGIFQIFIDGDLFKAQVTWPLYTGEEARESSLEH